MRKAQLTIEYLVVLIIMLLLFNGVTLDLLSSSVDYSEKLQTSEMINATRMAVKDAIQIISLQGTGAKKTVSVRAPPDCVYGLMGDILTVVCEYDSPAYRQGFNGEVIAETTSTVALSLSSNPIQSGDLGTVTVSKR